MPNNPFTCLAIFLLVLCLHSCAKSTMVSGRITNFVTGNPVKGMNVALSVVNKSGPVDSPSVDKLGEAFAQTDENGFYTLEITEKKVDAAGLIIGNQVPCFGFFSEIRSDKVTANKAREVNIKIDSVDAQLDIVLQNTSGTDKTIYLQVDCDASGEKGIFCCNHDRINPIAPGAQDTVHFQVTSSRFVSIYWGDQDFNGWVSPNIDSIFCPRNTTTGFVISF